MALPLAVTQRYRNQKSRDQLPWINLVRYMNDEELKIARNKNTVVYFYHTLSILYKIWRYFQHQVWWFKITACPQNWILYGTSCYMFHTSSHKQWKDANVSFILFNLFSSFRVIVLYVVLHVIICFNNKIFYYNDILTKQSVFYIIWILCSV